MTKWLLCTTPQGGQIYVNFDNAISIEPNPKGQTRIVFMGAEKESVYVREPAHDLVEQLT